MTDRPLQVLQVTTDDDRRGGQIFACDLEEGLRALGHDVRTVGLARGDVGGLGIDLLGSRRRAPRTLRSLRRAILHADVVVGHGSTTLPACAFASVGTDVPFVYRQISDSLFWADTPARRCRVRAALSRALRVVALWGGAARTLQQHFGVAADRIDCIPNGVHATRFPRVDRAAKGAARRRLGIPEHAFVVVYVGALVPEKGVDIAIDAVSTMDNGVLVIAGEGPERAALERQAGGGAAVRFVGALSRPQVVYACADLITLPSRGGDSMPAALIEAGMMGLPAVATPVAAIPEIVLDGRAGFIVPPNDVGAVAAAMHKLRVDPELRRVQGDAAARHCINNYSIETVARRWSATLSHVAA